MQSTFVQFFNAAFGLIAGSVSALAAGSLVLLIAGLLGILAIHLAQVVACWLLNVRIALVERRRARLGAAA